jgi:hypothetical protein
MPVVVLLQVNLAMGESDSQLHAIRTWWWETAKDGIISCAEISFEIVDY